MTFIVGMRCSDGLVMCSDSFEGDGLNRREVEKIYCYESKGEWGLTIGCSGNTAGITKFIDRIKNIEKLQNRIQIEEILEAGAQGIHEDFPEERLAFVAGLWMKNPDETYIYKMQDNSRCLLVEENYACTGLDSSLAYAALESIHDADLMPLDEGIRLAIFCTALMKKYSDGVGGRTWIYSYRNGSSQWESQPPEITKEIEDHYPLEGAGSLRSILWEYWQRKEGKA